MLSFAIRKCLFRVKRVEERTSVANEDRTLTERSPFVHEALVADGGGLAVADRFPVGDLGDPGTKDEVPLKRLAPAAVGTEVAVAEAREGREAELFGEKRVAAFATAGFDSSGASLAEDFFFEIRDPGFELDVLHAADLSFD